MSKTVKFISFTFLFFLLYFLLNEFYFKSAYQGLTGITGSKSIGFILAYLIVGIPIFVGVIALHPFKDFFYSLGVDKGFGRGMILAFIWSLPMLLGYASFFEFNQELTFFDVISGVICAGFFEELYFRGFLFGQLYRNTRLGFIPALIIGAIIFASVHLYQSQDPSTLLGIFMVTFLGAFLFAWLYVEWDYNLWVPIFLHLFMNLHWGLFDVSDNAFGNNMGNVFRILTIAFAVIGTIMYKKREGKKLSISRETIWMKRD